MEKMWMDNCTSSGLLQRSFDARGLNAGLPAGSNAPDGSTKARASAEVAIAFVSERAALAEPFVIVELAQHGSPAPRSGQDEVWRAVMVKTFLDAPIAEKMGVPAHHITSPQLAPRSADHAACEACASPHVVLDCLAWVLWQAQKARNHVLLQSVDL